MPGKYNISRSQGKIEARDHFKSRYKYLEELFTGTELCYVPYPIVNHSESGSDIYKGLGGHSSGRIHIYRY